MFNDLNNSQESSGNKCGHQPDAPRYFIPPEKHAKRPEILRRVQVAIQEYFKNPNILPLLNAANCSDRQQRSERREACVDILACILHYTDLVTLRVAIPQADGSTAGLTMPYLATLSGLGERRAERAIHDLKAAGIITVHPICVKLTDTAYKGLAAIRTVSKHLFTVLGFHDWLKHEQRKAQERRMSKIEKKRRKALANVQMGINAANLNTPERERTGHMASAAEHIASIKAGLKRRPPPD
ncbi:MAG: replication protein RepA [Methylobacter sp.]|nr:replication protein RepA [Candidatus Methylobacter titanis]